MERKPNIDRLISAILLEEPDAVPLAELGIDRNIMRAALGRETLSAEDVVDFCARVACLDYVRVLADGRDFPVGGRERRFRYSLYVEGETRRWLDEGEGVIRIAEDVDKYPFPSLDGIGSDTAERLRRIIDRRYPGMGLIAGFGDVFTRTWALLGFTRFCIALVRDRQLVRKVYRRVAELSTQECRVLMDAGVDAIWPSDDIAFVSGPMVSPRDLQEFFFPWLKGVCWLAKRRGLPVIYHSDGDLRPVMNDILECGVNAIHPVEPKAMNIEELKAVWGDRLALIGNIDLEYTLTRGTVGDVVRLVRRRICLIAPGGGYALGSSNTIPGYVKLNNYLAMVEVTKKYGRYSATG